MAMPETAIGLFPDVGWRIFPLAAARGDVGERLALTGAASAPTRRWATAWLIGSCRRLVCRPYGRRCRGWPGTGRTLADWCAHPIPNSYRPLGHEPGARGRILCLFFGPTCSRLVQALEPAEDGSRGSATCDAQVAIATTSPAGDEHGGTTSGRGQTTPATPADKNADAEAAQRRSPQDLATAGRLS